MLSRINLTTVFILGMLGSASSIQNPQRADKTTAIIPYNDNPFLTLNSCPVSDIPYPEFPSYHTLTVDGDHIYKFICNKLSMSEAFDSSSLLASHQSFIDRILKMRALHPTISNYIDLVFTHLENLNIYVYSKDSKLNMDTNKFGGAYLAQLQMLFVPGISNEHDSQTNLEIIRHELRHAAMNTVQQVLSQTNTVSTAPYFPNTVQQHKRFSNLLNEGINRCQQLEKHLILEEKNQLSSSIQNTLDLLRNKCTQDYLDFYQVTYTKLQIDHVLTSKDIGKIFNIPESGPSLLKKIIELPNNQQRLVFAFQDPLWAATDLIPKLSRHVQNKYDPRTHLLEFDAYLNGQLPQVLIEYLFPTLYKYTNELIQKALNTPVTFHHVEPSNVDPNVYFDVIKLNQKKLITLLTDPDNFNEADIPQQFLAADDLADDGLFDVAISGMKRIIQHNYFVKEATFNIARYEFRNENYEAAVEYFKKTIKLGMELTKEQHHMYSQALSKLRILEANQKDDVGVEKSRSLKR